MKIAFQKLKFHAASLKIIKTADDIIADYQSKGYRLSLRQLFYQFVSRNLIPNTERSYKNLGNTISLGRIAGLLDWDAIEDRIRVPRRAAQFDNIQDLVNDAIWSYRLPRWDGQDNYVELWVEKDALAGVLSPLAVEFHVTLMVNRGYSSQTAMYDSANRFIRADRAGKKCHLLYLGDHDPSGEDMVRDIGERLEMFGANVGIEKLALTMEQVKQYNPPPNPAKLSDSRAASYIADHGNESWEVDALPPDVLANIIRAALEKRVNMELMNAIKEREEIDKNSLRVAADRIGKPDDTGLVTAEVLKKETGIDPLEFLKLKMRRYQSE